MSSLVLEGVTTFSEWFSHAWLCTLTQLLIGCTHRSQLGSLMWWASRTCHPIGPPAELYRWVVSQVTGGSTGG
eukprot:scaffold239606_cov22-Tisochrysis_lutea.AAC.1